MSTSEATTKLPEIPIPDDLTITVVMRRPFRDGTPTVVEFFPETSRRAVFEEWREIAHGIAAGLLAEREADEEDLDEGNLDDDGQDVG